MAKMTYAKGTDKKIKSRPAKLSNKLRVCKARYSKTKAMEPPARNMSLTSVAQTSTFLVLCPL